MSACVSVQGKGVRKVQESVKGARWDARGAEACTREKSGGQKRLKRGYEKSRRECKRGRKGELSSRSCELNR